MIENNYTIYIHISPNNKYYIGITSRNPKIRWKNGCGYHHNKYFSNAIKKYGWNNFQHEIVASNLSKEAACNFERLLIEKLNTTDRKFGYNKSTGGEIGSIGCVRTTETKKKLSEAHIGIQAGENHPMYNKHHSEEAKQKMSESKKGRFCGEDNYFYGKHFNSENHPRARKVILLNTGEVFNTSRDILKSYDISVSHICDCCSGKRKSCGKLPDGTPMVWMYYEDYINQKESEVA